MITLLDSFNGRAISRHRTLESAVKAQRKHYKSFLRRNPGCYTHYGFEYDGDPVPCDRIFEVKMKLDFGGAK